MNMSSVQVDLKSKRIIRDERLSIIPFPRIEYIYEIISDEEDYYGLFPDLEFFISYLKNFKKSYDKLKFQMAAETIIKCIAYSDYDSEFTEFLNMPAEESSKLFVEIFDQLIEYEVQPVTKTKKGNK